MGSLWGNLLSIFKATAPISIGFNICLFVGMMVLFIIMNKRENKKTGTLILQWSSLAIGVLAILGALSNFLFSYVIF